MRFEPLSVEHAQDVMRIFNYYVEHGYAAYPERPLPVEFYTKMLEMTTGYPAFVIKDPAKGVVGFCFLRPYNPFPAFMQTAEISMFIDPAFVRKGLGTLALGHLEAEARKKGVLEILANISSKNLASIQFHQKQGFVECGRFLKIGRKHGQEFDVVWMQKTLR